MRRALIAAVCALALLPAAASAASGPGPVDAAAWAVFDPAADAMVGAASPDARRPIASATKIMTALVALDRLDPDEQIPVSGYDALPAESVAGLRPGDSLSLEDMLHALLLASANDAAIELARAAAASVERFVTLMNRKARNLGLRDTHFTNPIGLDHPAQYSSAADLARMAAELRRQEILARIVDTESKTLRSGLEPITVENRNPLLERAGWIDGVKTGQTLGAGWVLVASGERKGVGLIAVVLGASSEQGRDRAALELLRWGHGLYRKRTLLRRGEAVSESGIEHGGDRVVELIAGRAIEAAVRDDSGLRTKVDAPERVEGPVEEGERLGQVTLFAGERRLGAAPLLAGAAVERPSLAERTSPLAAVILIVAGLLVIMAGVVGIRGRRGEEARR